MKNTILKLPKGYNMKLTSNFNSSEWDCKCSHPECDTTLIDLAHLVKLQELRDEIGPLHITSGYRCEKHNSAVGGSKNSQHRKGTATDVVSRLHTPKELAKLADSNFKGMGVYPSFVHLDSRKTKKARW